MPKKVGYNRADSLLFTTRSHSGWVVSVFTVIYNKVSFRLGILGGSGGVVCPVSLKSAAFTFGVYFLHNGRR